jgi:hypothetical protein
MTIRWLNPDCTEAIITRGVLWWQRQAHVIRYCEHWTFVASGRRVLDADWWLCHKIEKQHRRELQRIADNRDWIDTARFPKARLLENK